MLMKFRPNTIQENYLQKKKKKFLGETKMK